MKRCYRILIHDYAGHAFPVSLSRTLANRGHEVVHVFASNLQTPRGGLANEAGDSSGLRFEAIEMSSDYVKDKYSFIKRRRHELTYGKRVGRFIEEWRPDVVLSGNTPTETQSGILKGAESVDAKFCYWVQDFYSIAVSKLAAKKMPIIGHLVGAYYKRLDRDQLKRSAAIINITEDFLPQLKEWNIDSEKCHVIPNWANLKSFPSFGKDNEWSRGQSLDGCFTYLYSGTLGMKHNPELIARLAESMLDRKDVRIVVNSEGLGAKYLIEQKERRSLDNLIVNGFQPFEKMAEVLSSADVLITVLEPDAGVFSVPSKTLAYLCAGRAILGGMPRANLAARIVIGEGAGIVVESNDIEGFIQSADDLYEDRARAEQMGECARKYAERTFDLRMITDQFENIFNKLVEE